MRKYYILESTTHTGRGFAVVDANMLTLETDDLDYLPGGYNIFVLREDIRIKNKYTWHSIGNLNIANSHGTFSFSFGSMIPLAVIVTGDFKLKPDWKKSKGLYCIISKSAPPEEDWFNVNEEYTSENINNVKSPLDNITEKAEAVEKAETEEKVKDENEIETETETEKIQEKIEIVKKIEEEGNINSFNQLMEKTFKQIDPFKTARKDYKWWRVTDIDLLLNKIDNTCYNNNTHVIKLLSEKFNKSQLIFGVYLGRDLNSDNLNDTFLESGAFVLGTRINEKNNIASSIKGGIKAGRYSDCYAIVYIDPVKGSIIF